MTLPRNEVALYRAAMADVATLALADLEAAWRQMPTEDAVSTRDGLADLLPAIITSGFLAAAAVTADWYDLLRYDLGARGEFTAIIPDPPDSGRGVAMAGWAVGPLFSASPSPETALSKLSGGLQRTVVDGGRQTVTVSSTQDPAKPGWTRVGTGGCDYCRKRIGLRITDSTIFESHDACGCVAVPDF